MGSKSNLLRTLAAISSSGVKSDALGVSSFVLKWRSGRDAKSPGNPLPVSLSKNTFALPILLPILKKTRFSTVWDGPIPDFNPPKDGSNPDSGHRPQIDECIFAASEILRIARGQRGPSRPRTSSSDHGVELADRSACVFACHRNPCVHLRCITHRRDP